MVCYVDHGLSHNAVQWHNFVKNQCIKLELAFVGKKVKLDKSSNQSLEAQAREARYSALKEVAGENGVVFTAHHQDDQVETFLLALKRGSGIKGLSAMTAHSLLITEKGALQVVRPLLNVSRQAIESRAKTLKLEWIEDESNLDQLFDRNFLRQTIVPLLESRWSGISKAIARTASHCQDAQALIDEVASVDLQQCLVDDNTLNIDALLSLSNSRFNYVLRYYLAQNGELMPSSHVLRQIKQQLSADGDKTPQVKIGHKWFRRFKNKLVLTDNFADISNWQQIIKLTTLNEKPVTIVLPDNLGQLVFASEICDLLATNITNEDIGSISDGLTCLWLPEKISELRLTFTHVNPTCLPDYRNHSRALKKILQELEIEPWQRKRIPLLFHGENLISALGYFVCQPFSIKNKQLKETGKLDRIRKVNVRWLASNNSG
ncbi:tRNA(Ile)-lysidine synthase [Thalassotalea profundi]|uniref:tRNA(Ile)-lysidine synthase n=2 Tax=Thalassotalea profundi TaxID=2036687 RepID=A0ABQ3ILZ8_9GAMM|nr:tRNA(Ile)-lysidine synthase [Thalassotalea profundi]